ncbi:MAG TPA: HupE/UreJ family protein [Steroidobacteraceae bacterium]|nr:HupE/UreJ family protein [Steroidobacteraceae bacterium]
MRWVALIACALACAAPAARAAAPGVSYSTWVLGEHGVTLRYVLPALEAERLTGSAVPVLTVSKLGDYVLGHVAVTSGHADCPAIDQGYDLGRVDPLEVGAGLYGFEIVFRCTETPGALALHEHALFDRDPAHVDFARIERDGHSVQQLFTASRQILRVPAEGPVPAAAPAQYAQLGLAHLLRGLDRLCLLLAALVLVRSARELGLVLAALTAGYALSLIIEATGSVLPRMEPIGAYVGFLVALLAVSIAVRETPESRRALLALGFPLLLLLLALGTALAHATQAALVLFGAALVSGGLLAIVATSGLPAALCAGLFGFLDGFTLPALLGPLHAAARTEALMVSAYDAGAVLAACACLGLVATTFVWLRSRSLPIPRPFLNDVAAACLGGIGTVWFLSRLHS